MKTYADFIRSCGCSVCGDDTATEQHHLIDLEFVTKGMGRKVAEAISIPLCSYHHRLLHSDLMHWEQAYGSQTQHLARTLEWAFLAGWRMNHGD